MTLFLPVKHCSKGDRDRQFPLFLNKEYRFRSHYHLTLHFPHFHRCQDNQDLIYCKDLLSSEGFHLLQIEDRDFLAF